LAFLFSLTASAGADTFDISGPPLVNIDTPSSSPSSVSLTATGFPNEIVTDLNLAVEIDGEFATNIDIFLTHGPVTVQVYDATSDFESVMDAVFDDSATTPAPKDSDIIGTFLPDNPLSAFNGLPLAGTWTITFHDLILDGDGDDLISWSISGSTIPEPGTLMLFGVGLVGLAAWTVRRRRKARA
jgi:hypothetical protein